MTSSESVMPNVAEILAEVLRKIDPRLQPFLLARLERFAAHRYRIWAGDQTEPSVREGLLACVDREEEIARRVESLDPNAAAIQDAFESRIAATRHDDLQATAAVAAAPARRPWRRGVTRKRDVRR